MKLLKDLLYGCRLQEVQGSTNVAVERISFDSRKVGALGLFVAVKGVHVNGHDYIAKAISEGAIVVVCEQLPSNVNEEVVYVQVQDSSEALGLISSNFYGSPSDNIELIGITGTNGKTTTATLCFQMLQMLGYKVGLISTIENKIHKEVIPATHTTPDPVQLNALLKDMVDAGCEYAIMEVSSHAIHQKRIAGLNFKIGIFSNITHDHLDYHKTFNEYIKAKKAFFDNLPAGSTAIINIDDKNGGVMVQNTKARIVTMGIKNMADRKARVVENLLQGLHLIIDQKELYCRLVGAFNAYNLLAVYSIGCELGLDPLQLLTTISLLEPVNGRFQIMRSEKGVHGVVDYAHTPDALKNVLSTLNELREGDSKIITVVGCGGDRDKTKRPIMAEMACELSDRVYLTSDNPRTETPSNILNDMKAGVPAHLFMRYTTVEDRAEAIKAALMEAKSGDVVLIAGKGHETYQEINGVRHHFDDMEVLTQTLKLLS